MNEHAGDGIALAEQPVPHRPPTFWQRLRGRFTRAGDHQRQLQLLDDAIALHPEVVVNYVLRGELYLKRREDDLAASDFRRAVQLATEQIETNNWGIIVQAMHDRALVGLRQAQRRSNGRDARQPNRLLVEDGIEKSYGHSTQTED